MKQKISAFIITKNEERNINRALESIKWADEIIIIDGYSTDNTCEIAKKYHAHIILSKYEGHDAEKNKAIKICKYGWIVEIDADEELTANSESEIREAIKNEEYSGYKLLREETFLGKVIIKAQKIRVYQNKFLYKGYTHEVLQITGKIGKLKTAINHYNNQTIDECLEYNQSLSTKEVDKLLKEHPNLSRAGILARMIGLNIYTFTMYYVYFGLIFKGFPGLTFTLFGCYHVNTIYMKYYERKYNQKINKIN
jgi:glycosyltransferase involved in cell wall biosynthesis